MIAHHHLYSDLTYLGRFGLTTLLVRRPPVNRTEVLCASKGSNAGRNDTVVPVGTVTLTFTTPGPVTAIQPSPAITMSYDDCSHPSPVI
jgi:hypothetical protein